MARLTVTALALTSGATPHPEATERLSEIGVGTEERPLRVPTHPRPLQRRCNNLRERRCELDEEPGI